jgi:hypothetical protein
MIKFFSFSSSGDVEENISRSMSQSLAGIENLPDEILIELFMYLTSQELKSIMLTNQSFSNIIGASIKLMQKFFLKISSNRKWDFDTLNWLQRKHQMIKFIDFHVDVALDDVLMSGLGNIGVSVKIVEFVDCKMHANDFVRILSTIQNLQKLTVIHTKIIGEAEIFLSFEHLESLRVINSEIDYEMFKCALNLREVLVEAIECQKIDLCEFQKTLCRQLQLKSLVLINLRFSNLFDMNRMTYPFQLSSLEIYNCHFSHKEHFEQFLVIQNNLNEMELAISNMKLGLDRTRYFESVIECVLQKELLKCLTLKIDEYNFSNFNFMLTNHIETLSVSLRNTNFVSSNYLKYFTNLKSLELDQKELFDEDYEVLSKIESLNHLKVSNLKSEHFGKLKIKNLSSLHIHETEIDAIDWIKFVENNSKVTKLAINFSLLVEFDKNLLEFLTQKWKDLEHVELIDKYVGFENTIYEMICGNCKNLKYLKLWNINIEKDFSDEDRIYLKDRNVKFHLFNDESLNKPMIPF